MNLAFSMQEVMRGTHHFVDPKFGSAEEQEFYFSITWGQIVSRFVSPLSPEFMKTTARGVINVAGLTNGEVPTDGTLELNYFRNQTLQYTLDFRVKGESYRYVGKKTDVKLWRPLCLVKSHTTCYGVLTNSKDEIVSKSITHFELEPAVVFNFLSSIRVALS